VFRSSEPGQAEIITFAERPWRTVVAAHIALEWIFQSTVSIYRVWNTCVSWVPCFSLQPCRTLRVVRREISLFIRISRYHLTDRSSFLRDSMRKYAVVSGYCNVLSIYHAKHVFRERSCDNDRPHPFTSMIGFTLNSLYEAVYSNVNKIIWLARSRFARNASLIGKARILWDRVEDFCQLKICPIIIYCTQIKLLP